MDLTRRRRPSFPLVPLAPLAGCLLLSRVLAHAAPAPGAGRPALTPLHPLSLALPGAPAAVLSADVDGDGRRDLVVVVAYNQWDEVAITESSTMDDVQGLVDVMTIVPALFDRRELRVYRAQGNGAYAPPLTLALPLSVLALAAGPPGTPVVALTDAGASVLPLRPAGDAAPRGVDRGPAGDGGHRQLPRRPRPDGGRRRRRPPRPAAAGPRRARRLPRPRRPRGDARKAASRLAVPGEAFRSARDLEHRYPLPQIEDVDGDGLPDLVFRDPVKRWRSVWVARNAGQGQVPAGRRGRPRHAAIRSAPNPVWLGDLDGSGRAEVVFRQSLDDPKRGSLRQEMAKAREPHGRLTFRRLSKELAPEKTAYRTLDITGWGLEGIEADSRTTRDPAAGRLSWT